jgi:hypothetical protein
MKVYLWKNRIGYWQWKFCLNGLEITPLKNKYNYSSSMIPAIGYTTKKSCKRGFKRWLVKAHREIDMAFLGWVEPVDIEWVEID